MRLKKGIGYNVVVSTLARIVNVAIGVVIIGLTTRYLGQSGFGDFSTILAFLFVFSVLADLGLYPLLLREISKDGADEAHIVGNIFTMRLVIGFLVFSLAALIGFSMPYSAAVKAGLAIAAFGYWLMSNMQILMAIFQKYLSTDKAAFAEVGSRLVQLGLVYFFIFKDFGFLSIVWTFTLINIFNFFWLVIAARKHVPFQLKINFPFWKKTFLEGYALGIGAILVMLYFKLDTVLLSLMKSSAEVGIYSLPYRILETLIFFPSMFVGLVTPQLSRYVFLEPEKFKKISQLSLNLLLLAIVPLVVGTLLFSGDLITLVGGSAFTTSARVLDILIFGVAIIFISNLFYQIILVLEKQKHLMLIFGVGALYNIIANLIFIPKYSYYAAAINTVITEALVVGLMFLVIIRASRYALSFGVAYKAILASLAMAGVLYLLPHWNFFILIGLAVIFYLAFLCLFRAVPWEELRFLRQKENPA